MSDRIPFNKPYFTGKESEFIQQAIKSGRVSGDGLFTKKCQTFFEERYTFRKALLTTSCTDALEMAAILAGIGPGDEVIVPSFTFASTANAFLLRGAKVVFADSLPDHPNVDPSSVKSLINKRTKAIVPVHYAGSACNMDEIIAIGNEHDVLIIEDAAQAIDSSYYGKALGSFGSMAAISFHETKNITSGEGGLLVINDDRFIERAEIIREKGTNRSAFMRGEVERYGWVDIGSSYLPSDMIAAFLLAQIESLDQIQERRLELWNNYNTLLKPLALNGYFNLPFLTEGGTNNGAIFYIVCRSSEERSDLIRFLAEKNIGSAFHYNALHKSGIQNTGFNDEPVNATLFGEKLLRLPLYFELTVDDQTRIVKAITSYFQGV